AYGCFWREADEKNESGNRKTAAANAGESHRERDHKSDGQEHPTPRNSIFDVQSTLGLSESRPAPGSGIFSRLHRPRAVGATDARIIPIVKRVVGHVVRADVIPNPRPIPIRKRIKFC